MLYNEWPAPVSICTSLTSYLEIACHETENLALSYGIRTVPKISLKY